ncbi:MAG: hypothetical protein R3F48_08545 [Candidatus Zixiibacteriota bacterium]
MVAKRVNKSTNQPTRLISKMHKSILNFFYTFFGILNRYGKKRKHDLGLIDEVFGIFIGITLSVAFFVTSNGTWSFRVWETGFNIVLSILSVLAIVLITLIIAVNQKLFTNRLILYMLATLITFGGLEFIMRVSHNDLAPQREELQALLIGGLLWIIVREGANLILNLIDRRN